MIKFAQLNVLNHSPNDPYKRNNNMIFYEKLNPLVAFTVSLTVLPTTPFLSISRKKGGKIEIAFFCSSCAFYNVIEIEINWKVEPSGSSYSKI
jgi:hypothetical protein